MVLLRCLTLFLLICGRMSEPWPFVSKREAGVLKVGLDWCGVPAIVSSLGLPNTRAKPLQHAQSGACLGSAHRDPHTALQPILDTPEVWAECGQVFAVPTC